MKVEEEIAKDEARRSLEMPETPPHQFQGRADQGCLVCGKPDRNPIHDGRDVELELILYFVTEGKQGTFPEWLSAFYAAPKLSMPVWDAADVLGLETVSRDEWIARARIWINAERKAQEHVMQRATL